MTDSQYFCVFPAYWHMGISNENCAEIGFDYEPGFENIGYERSLPAEKT